MPFVTILEAFTKFSYMYGCPVPGLCLLVESFSCTFSSSSDTKFFNRDNPSTKHCSVESATGCSKASSYEQC